MFWSEGQYINTLINIALGWGGINTLTTNAFGERMNIKRLLMICVGEKLRANVLWEKGEYALIANTLVASIHLPLSLWVDLILIDNKGFRWEFFYCLLQGNMLCVIIL